MAIIVYNRNTEDYGSHPNNYPIYRGGSILGNPYTHKQLQGTLAIYQTRTREEAIERYDGYFDLQYSCNKEFKAILDEMFEKYKNGEDIYLECYCHPLQCHGNIIAKKLQKRLLKEKIREEKEKRYGRQW